MVGWMDEWMNRWIDDLIDILIQHLSKNTLNKYTINNPDSNSTFKMTILWQCQDTFLSGHVMVDKFLKLEVWKDFFFFF